MKKKIAIIDYGMGNIFSIQTALNKVNLESYVTSDVEKIMKSDGIILPGVGAFSKAMEEIKKRNLDQVIINANKKNMIIIGICLGMQLLFEKSYENKVTKGLGLIKGEVVSFLRDPNSKNQFNVGWSKIHLSSNNKDLLINETNKSYMYFIHSYYVKPTEKNVETSYSYFKDIKFTSSVKKNNLYAYQFHPEKSAENGMIIYKSLSKIINR